MTVKTESKHNLLIEAKVAAHILGFLEEIAKDEYSQEMARKTRLSLEAAIEEADE